MKPADDSSLFSKLRRTFRADVLDCAPDEELLEQFVAQRDEAAFAALMRRHGPMVWSVCRRALVHRQDAEDAFQATFLVLVGKAASIGRPKLLANWLFGVARRAASNMRATRARRARHEHLCAKPPDIQFMLEGPRDDLGEVLDEELARLPAKYRLPLLLCGLEGMTHAVAGKYLGWPTGTVAGRLSRGRQLLRSRLLRRGVTAPAAVLTALLAPDATLAAVPPHLVAVSLRSAVSILCGKSAEVALPSAAVTLMQSVLTKMFLAKLWATTVIMAAFAMSLGGAATIWRLMPSANILPSASAQVAPRPMRSGVPTPPVISVPGRRPTDAATATASVIRLPTDPNAVVLRMDRSIESSAGTSAVLSIYADGRVVAEIPDGLTSLSATDLTRYAKNRAREQTSGKDLQPPRIKVIEGRISARELQELMRFALREQEFFAFEPDAVRAAIRDKHHSDGNVSDRTDDTTTSFRIQTADHRHDVRWSKLTKAAWDFPKVERLLQLHALDRRLFRVFSVLLAGGPEQVDAVVTKMNELVLPYYRLYPDVAPLTAADLFLVTPSADGSIMRFTFSRNKDKLVRNPLFEVSLDFPRQGEPTICYVIPPGKSFRGRVVDLLGFVPLF
jgi:RNA polymerase sigma factor (sigma-70 family)